MRYMLVANQTVASSQLRAAVLEIQSTDPGVEFNLIVPATRVVHGLIWDEVETKAAAQARVDIGLADLRQAGCRVMEGRVGDEDPVLAVDDELRRLRYDGIVLSTLPPGLSRWLKLDALSRIRRRVGPGRPVLHIVSDDGAAAVSTGPTSRPTSER